MSQTKISKAASMTMADHAVCVQVLLPGGAMAQAGEPALLVQVGDQLYPLSLEVSGRVIRWLIQPGDTLSAASDLAELERAPGFCLAGEAYSAVTETLAADGRFIDYLVTLRRDREGHQRTKFSPISLVLSLMVPFDISGFIFCYLRKISCVKAVHFVRGSKPCILGM